MDDKRIQDIKHEQLKNENRTPKRGAGVVLNVYKNLCETPRERLERLRVERPEYAHEVLSYAGRLDPMAEGAMLVLVGEANNSREQYLDMSKEYVLDVLFGFSTDTYDILGRVMEAGDPTDITKRLVEEGLNEFRGTTAQEYPPYSSKTVDGKSLFEWARSNMLGNIVIPQKTVTIYDIGVTSIYKLSEKTFLHYVEQQVEKVNGDFRQDEILRIWHRHLRQTGDRSFPCVTVKISCSSGVYARSVANGLGAYLGVPALSLHILRTKVGSYTVDKSLK